MPQKGTIIAGTPVFPEVEFLLGPVSFSEPEMIRFASLFDPLPLHTNPEYARSTQFGGIIASGSLLFVEFHKQFFIPQFGASIVAGLSIDNWTFLKPHYPDTAVSCRLSVKNILLKPEKGVAVIHWKYAFFPDGTLDLIQTSDFTIMHRPDNLLPLQS